MKCADKLLGELSTTHDKTNGTHSGILFDGKNILIYREDIGRHNVFDKIYGAALREKIFLGDINDYLQWALLLQNDYQSCPHEYSRCRCKICTDNLFNKYC